MSGIVKMYAPFVKMDKENRMVFGYATTATIDSQDEIVDLEASFEAVDDWKKWANIKEMHREETAVGIAPIIEKHVGVGVYIGAEIVDDQAWKKCLKGVYKGFSIGGHNPVRKVKDDNKTHVIKYTLREISLVDRPANPDSMFTVAKRDEDASTEADGGEKMEEPEKKPEEKPETSNPVAEATAKPEEAKDVKEKKEVAAETPAKSDETITVSKADFERLQVQTQELEKALAKSKEQDLVANAILKAVEKLEPKVKKVHEEPEKEVTKSEEEKVNEMRKQMEKMSVGELTQLMLKRTPTSKEE
jgi:hypothetical protein